MIHVLPIDDLITHTESVFCWCRPRILDEDGIKIIVHNAADGREADEGIKEDWT